MIAFYNGYPIVYADTSTYIVSGFTFEPPFDRPLTYGIFIRLASLNGFSLWGVAVLQSWVLSFLILLSVRDLTSFKRPYAMYLAIMAFFSVFTVLPWVSGQIIADIFTSVGVLCIIHLFLNDKLKRPARIFLYFLFFLSTSMHMSHILINGLLILLIILWQQPRFFPSVRKNYQTAGLLSLFITLGFLTMGSSISKSRNVFIMGRMAENGILVQFLKDHCANNEYKLCDCRDSIPQNTTDFLWDSHSPLYTQFGSWKEAQEEFGKIIGATMVRPEYLYLHLKESIKSTFRQLFEFDAGDGNGPFIEGSVLYDRIQKYFPSEVRAYRNSKQNRNDLLPAMRVLNMLYRVIIAGSVLCVLLFLLIRRYSCRIEIGRKRILYILLSAIVLNAAINASLVITTDRFGAKLIWFLPFALFLVFPLKKGKELD